MGSFHIRYFYTSVSFLGHFFCPFLSHFIYFIFRNFTSKQLSQPNTKHSRNLSSNPAIEISFKMLYNAAILSVLAASTSIISVSIAAPVNARASPPSCPTGTSYVDYESTSGFKGCTATPADYQYGPRKYWSSCPTALGNWYVCANGFKGCTTDTTVCDKSSGWIPSVLPPVETETCPYGQQYYALLGSRDAAQIPPSAILSPRTLKDPAHSARTTMSALLASRGAVLILLSAIPSLNLAPPSAILSQCPILVLMASNTMSALLDSRDVVPIPLSATPRIQTPRRSPQ